MKITFPADPTGSGHPILKNVATLTPVNGFYALLVVDVVAGEGWVDPNTGATRIEVKLPACVLAATLAAVEAMA